MCPNGASILFTYTVGVSMPGSRTAEPYATSTFSSFGGNSQIISAMQNSCSQLATQMLNGFNAQNVAFLQGINSLDKSLCDIRYNAEKNATAIIQAGNDNTNKILQAIVTDRFNTLQTDLALARSQISQLEQTQNIVNQLKNSCGCGCGCGNSCNC